MRMSVPAIDAQTLHYWISLPAGISFWL